MEIIEQVFDELHPRDSVWGAHLIETVSLEHTPVPVRYRLRYMIEINMIYLDQSHAYCEIWDMERLEWRKIMILAGMAWAATAEYTPENRRRRPPEVLAARDELRERVLMLLSIRERESGHHASPAR